MLINCPECELQVSDKAVSCPHCGYPLKGFSKKSTRGKSRMRLPNGFGQITLLKSSTLRKPYRAMVTVGKDENGKPICKLLKPQAYFKTYNEAYEALVEYNRNPYEIDTSITTEKLYKEWLAEYSKTCKSDSSIRTIKSAWACCTSIYNVEIRLLRPKNIKKCMDSAKSPNMQARIKSLFNKMLDYALENEYVDKNYARAFNISNEITKNINSNKKDHLSFTNEELNLLWLNKEIPYVNIILFQCYSGLRPQEIGLIKRENVNLNENIIVCGMKTEAGTNRTVPIHHKIRHIIEQQMELSEKYHVEWLFFTDKHEILTYDSYRRKFENVIKALNINPNHRPHDPRKTFVTLAKAAGVDEYAIKKIVGHAINDITEKIYTDRDNNWLISEIEKI